MLWDCHQKSCSLWPPSRSAWGFCFSIYFPTVDIFKILSFDIQVGLKRYLVRWLTLIWLLVKIIISSCSLPSILWVFCLFLIIFQEVIVYFSFYIMASFRDCKGYIEIYNSFAVSCGVRWGSNFICAPYCELIIPYALLNHFSFLKLM